MDACLEKQKDKRPASLADVVPILDSNRGSSSADDLTPTRGDAGTPVVVPPIRPPLDALLDVDDPHCASHNSFAVRIEKHGPGRAERVSLVLEASFIDGNRQSSAPNVRFPIHGSPDGSYVTDISPGVPKYFRLLGTTHHAGNRDLGNATWQLSAEGRFPQSSGKKLELVLKIESDFELPRFRLRFDVSADAARQLRFAGIDRITTP